MTKFNVKINVNNYLKAVFEPDSQKFKVFIDSPNNISKVNLDYAPIKFNVVIDNIAPFKVNMALGVGIGIPAGGDKGQVLTKATDDDYDTKWIEPEVGEGIGVPAGGDKGQALIKATDNDFETKWANVEGTGIGLINEIDGGFPETVYLINQDVDGGFIDSTYTQGQTIDGGEV